LGIIPSEPADDATFMRRVYLDVIGTLPTADEVRAFLADAAADKRNKLVDRVLAREEYADYWAMRWSDLLRVDRDRVTPHVAVATSRWLRRQFAENRPYDQFVRDIVTVQGNTAAEGPTTTSPWRAFSPASSARTFRPEEWRSSPAVAPIWRTPAPASSCPPRRWERRRPNSPPAATAA
jgi:hypothetical protein